MTDAPRLRSLLGSYASNTHMRVGRVFGVVLLSAVLQVLTQTILARTLPKTEVGLISLLIGTLPILSTLSLLGQAASTVRYLSRTGVARYDTPAHVRRVMAVVVPAGVAVSLGAVWFYGLTAGLAVTLVVLVLSQNAATIVSSVMRAAHRYELAMVAARLPVVAAAVALAALLATGTLTFTTALVALAASFGLSAAAFYVKAVREVGRGTERVPGFVFREGFFLLGLNMAFAVMIALDKFIIGKMMDYADLAVYASIFAIMRGFDFLFYSISHVMMPRVNVVERLDLRRLNAPVAVLAALVAAFYLLLGKQVVHLLYAGLYDEGAYLIAPFVLSGIAKLFYSVPSSIIGGRLPRAALKQFLVFSMVALVIHIALDIAFIRSAGLLGAAIATAIAWAIRVVGGYVIVARHREHLEVRPQGQLET